MLTKHFNLTRNISLVFNKVQSGNPQKSMDTKRKYVNPFANTGFFSALAFIDYKRKVTTQLKRMEAKGNFGNEEKGANTTRKYTNPFASAGVFSKGLLQVLKLK